MSTPNMWLISTKYGDQSSFKMIPVNKECPFNECIFDPTNAVLAVVSKEKKETFHLLPKLDENGDILEVKKKRKSGKPYSEQRVVLDTYYEYFIQDEKEILELISGFAQNSSSTPLDYKKIVADAFKDQLLNSQQSQ